jgi:membrane dipeptidase
VNARTDQILIDGLLVSRWGPETFAEMRNAGLTAANCTCSVWEDFGETMANIGRFLGWFREYPDLIRQIESVDDIASARAAGQTGVILGFQNTSALEGRLSNLELFHRVGVRIVQLTYNYQNDIGTGCYEPSGDGGLTEFGRGVVAEMNRLGILIDLSHVGTATSNDVLRESTTPIAITHAAPLGLHAHPRNKTDALLRSVAERGGVVGITALSWFLRGGEDSTLDDYFDALDYAVNLIGEDHVAIGTDITEGHGRAFLDWTMRNRGDGPSLVDVGDMVDGFPMPLGLRRIADMGHLPDRLSQRGWPSGRIDKVLGENWVRLFGEVWTGTEGRAATTRESWATR